MQNKNEEMLGVVQYCELTGFPRMLMSRVTGISIQHERGEQHMDVIFLSGEMETKSVRLSLDVARMLRTALETMVILKENEQQ